MLKILIFTKLDLQRYVHGCTLVGLSATLSDSLDNFDEFDGLLLPGGNDVDPSLYGQENTASKGIDRQYDEDSIKAIDYFLSHNKPILGICKGLQIINVALGGSLIQDIKGHKVKEVSHVHKVKAISKNRLTPYYGDEFFVNSRHHQAIDRCGIGLKVTYEAEDGTIEAVEHESKKLLAVQWHPERLLEGEAKEGIKVFEAYKEMFKA